MPPPGAAYRPAVGSTWKRASPTPCGRRRPRGHRVNVLDEHGGRSWVIGGAHDIARDPESGALTGGAGPRRDGAAIAV